MDIEATFIMQSALAFVVGTQLLLIWQYDKDGSRAALHWAGAFYCVSVGWIFVLMRGTSQDIVLTLLINFGFLFAPVLILSGVFVRMKVPSPKKTLLSIFVLYLLAQTALTAFEASALHRIVGVNLFILALQWISAYYVLKSNMGRLANYVLAAGFILVGFASALRICGILFTGEDVYGFGQENGLIFFILLTIVNITEGFTCLGALLVDRIDLISRQALTDPMTSCLNRRGFDEAASETIARAARGKNTLVMVVADLDRFKKLNDTYGHGAGDNAIKHFTQVVTQEIRSVDHFGRHGGEEFVFLLWQTDLTGAEDLVARIRHRLSQSQIPGLPADYRLTSSFGATPLEPGETDINAIIHRADLALYRAKANGRDQLQYLDKNDEALAQREFDALQSAPG